jgi:hypothetical protein
MIVLAQHRLSMIVLCENVAMSKMNKTSKTAAFSGATFPPIHHKTTIIIQYDVCQAQWRDITYLGDECDSLGHIHKDLHALVRKLILGGVQNCGPLLREG